MQNVVPIAELGGFIEEVITQMNNGLVATRAKGIVVEMPDAIQITATVVQTWQPETLQIVGVRESQENGKQGGKTTQSESGGGNEITTSKDNSTRNDNGENRHQQTTDTDTTYTE
jgi:hypothetical protein